MAVWAGLLGAYQFQQSKFGTNESQPTFKGGKVTHSFEKIKKKLATARRDFYLMFKKAAVAFLCKWELAERAFLI